MIWTGLLCLKINKTLKSSLNKFKTPQTFKEDLYEDAKTNFMSGFISMVSFGQTPGDTATEKPTQDVSEQYEEDEEKDTEYVTKEMEEAPLIGTKFINIETSPISLLLGYINVGVDVKVLNRITVSPEVGYLGVEINNVKVSAMNYGLGFHYYFSGPALSSGAYVHPLYSRYLLEAEDGYNEASIGFHSIGATLGYHWIWDSGFNMKLAAGLQRLSLDSELRYDNGEEIDLPSLSGIKPALEFSMGIAF